MMLKQTWLIPVSHEERNAWVPGTAPLMTITVSHRLQCTRTAHENDIPAGPWTLLPLMCNMYCPLQCSSPCSDCNAHKAHLTDWLLSLMMQYNTGYGWNDVPAGPWTLHPQAATGGPPWASTPYYAQRSGTEGCDAVQEQMLRSTLQINTGRQLLWCAHAHFATAKIIGKVLSDSYCFSTSLLMQL
jgi:hypothetical protein